MWGVREVIYAVIVFFFIQFLIRSLLSKHGCKLPPGPKGWPIVGSLPLLGSMPHIALAEMSKIYGPIIHLRLGSYGMVVASTPDSARAFLKTHDLNFSNRPIDLGAIHIAYNSQDMVHAEYGPRWKLLRKLTSLHMLGGRAIEHWASVRKVELGHMLQVMCESSRGGEPVILAEMLAFAMANMLGQVILSRRVFVTKGSESNEFKDMVIELMTSAGGFYIGDYVPCIGWMDLQGIVRGMKHLHNKFDAILNNMLKDHIKTKHERKEKPDLVDVLMENRDNIENERLTDTNMKALLLNFFAGGFETSSSTIEWALTEMMKNPRILIRAQAEMDQIVGRNRRVEESDIPNLPYLQAICKETFRKHPSTPLSLPRVSLEPCEVNGYCIPKGTRLNINIWAIGRDPNIWENPLEFDPDRFLSGENAKIDPSGNHFELIPFGAGRRICAGARMAVVIVEYLLGTLVQSFDWKLPDGVEEINMEEKFGLALQKAVHLTAIVTPRLQPGAYAV
ncbi:flavonoid 3',5'-hydroxylase [Ranunculus cassubicifolius]